MEDAIFALIPIFALAIPLAGIVVFGLQKLARTRLEEARIRAGMSERGSDDEITVLRDEVAELRRELSDVQERMDFAERLLTKAVEERQIGS